VIKIHIEDYQSIGEIDIEVEGLTLICGPSNIGKSSIQRAISGALHNDAGNFFVRTGRPNTKVTIDDGDINFTWTKGQGVNKYEVNGEEFIHMGHDVPPPVKDAGYWDLVAGGETHSVQVAEQFDPPFAITKGSGTKLGGIYSAITKTDVLNKASSRCSKDLRAIKQEANLRAKDLAKVEDELKEFDEIPELVAAANDTITLYESIKTIAKRLENLKILRDSLSKAQDKVRVLSSVSSVLVPEISLEKTTARLTVLKRIQENLLRHSSRVQSLSGVGSVEIPVLDTESSERKLEKLRRLQVQFIGVGDTIHQSHCQIPVIVAKIDRLGDKLPDNCPLCGAYVAEEDLTHLHDFDAGSF